MDKQKRVDKVKELFYVIISDGDLDSMDYEHAVKEAKAEAEENPGMVVHVLGVVTSFLAKLQIESIKVRSKDPNES